MKLITTIIFLFIFDINFCVAQDTTIVLTPRMYDTNFEQIFISAIDGWLFKDGNDSSWSRKDINLNGWERLNPTELSAKYADKNGKAECWFRIKIKLDSAFGYDNFGLRINTWAATDIYIDGNLIVSSGNTGKDGIEFRENRPYGKYPVPVNLKPGNEYTIALHFTDYLSPFPPASLKSESIRFQNLLALTGPKYNDDLLQFIRDLTCFNTIWISVSILLSLLFWLLSIQNPAEKNLRLIALCTTSFSLSAICTTLRYSFGISYLESEIYSYGFSLFNVLLLIMMMLILSNIFKGSISTKLKIFVVLYFILYLVTNFLNVSLSRICWTVLICSFMSVSFYYIASSWRELKGAQWAIVAGVLFSSIWAAVYFFVIGMNKVQDFTIIFLFVTGIYLSFPLSLLVYVAMRLKEVIKEVRENSEQVVRMSEEKKEQALNQQKILEEEVKRQTSEIRSALDNLKATQSQLIHSEKMASLGELTAGIAHEIQNPLNFVNNFSEVNIELIAEMKDEIAKGNTEEVKTIANDIEANEQKINLHGKRADAIVKGMLLHSRTSSGVKEPIDLNALADEYLRLAYHGLRAKDKSFNATMKTDYDENIGNVNVVPQDIGRVILNLITNAFYAVNEKKKRSPDGYEPAVSVITEKIGDKTVIRVKDNGYGISQKVMNKIFQPFFTTKPAGQGTGLGLSLSYDIVNAHGGEIKVHSDENEGTVFTVSLPLAK